MQTLEERPKPQPLYSKELLGRVTHVLDQSTHSRKQLQQFVNAFQKRIDAEISYARNLDSVGKLLQRFIQPQTEKAASYVCSAFKVNNEQRANQARQLAQSLRSQIIEVASQMLREHTAETKKIEKNVKKLNKDLTHYEENYERALKNYKDVDKETEQMIINKNILKFTSQIPQQKKIKLITKTMESLKEKKQYESLYIQSLRSLNDFIATYRRQAVGALNILEEYQEGRIKIQSDCMRKLIVCEISMFKNVEYDLINISKQMEGINPRKDIQIFTAEQKQRDGQLEKQVREREQSRYTEKLLAIDKSMLAISLRKVEQEYFSWMLNLKKNKTLRSIVEQRWKYLNQSLIKSKPIEQSNHVLANGTGQKKIEGTSEEKPQQKVQQGEQLTKEQQQKKPQLPAENKAQIEKKSEETTQQTAEKEGANNKSPQNRLSYNESSDIKSEFSDSDGVQVYTLNTSEMEMMRVWVELHQKQKILHQPLLTGQTTIQQKSAQELFYHFMVISQIVAKYWLGMIEPTGKKLRSSYHITKFKKIIRQSHVNRLMAEIFIEEYRVQHQVNIANQAVKPLAQVLGILLEECNKNEDVFVGRGVIGLLFTFSYCDEKNSKKLFYQNSTITNAKLWKKHDFWDGAIFEATYEEMALFSIQKGETHSETVLREKNIIFSQLASYCHYMIMLGISSKNVRLIVGRYCRLYQMNEDQNKDLSKMITNTYRQYKDMLAIGAI